MPLDKHGCLGLNLLLFLSQAIEELFLLPQPLILAESALFFSQPLLAQVLCPLLPTSVLLPPSASFQPSRGPFAASS